MSKVHHQAEDPNWSLYPDTVLRLHHPSTPLTVDLRKSLVDVQCRLLRVMGPAEEFGIVTAFNPIGRSLSAAENEARHARLGALLVRDGLPHLPADGLSPDGRHREEGFAVWTSSQAVALLARRLEQSAYFWFDGIAFWIMGALVAVPPIRLPNS